MYTFRLLMLPHLCVEIVYHNHLLVCTNLWTLLHTNINYRKFLHSHFKANKQRLMIVISYRVASPPLCALCLLILLMATTIQLLYCFIQLETLRVIKQTFVIYIFYKFLCFYLLRRTRQDLVCECPIKAHAPNRLRVLISSIDHKSLSVY